MTHDLKNQKQIIDLTAMATLGVLCASWGLSQVAIKVAIPGVPPLLQSGIRSVGATVLIWSLMAIRREPVLEKDGTLWWGLAAGILFALEFILIYWGLEFTNASRSVIFIYMSPFVVALGAELFIPGEHLRKIQVLGLCCAFVGIVVVFSESLSFPNYRMLIGDAMMTVAAVLWGATTVLIKASPLVRVKPNKVLLYQLAVSAMVLPLASLARGEPGIASDDISDCRLSGLPNSLGRIYYISGLVLAHSPLSPFAFGIIHLSYATFRSACRWSAAQRADYRRTVTCAGFGGYRYLSGESTTCQLIHDNIMIAVRNL